MSGQRTNEKDIINVIDEFDYSTQNDAYNEKFKSWRQRKNNLYAFSFTKNQRESVYIEGRGFMDNSREDTEKKVLAHIFYTLGIAVLMMVFFNNFFEKLVIKLLELCGLNIHINLINSVKFGGSVEIAVTLIILTLMKILLPMVYLHKKFKLPRKVEIMGSMNDPASLMGAISAAFWVCVVSTLPLAYSTESREIVSFFSSDSIDTSIWNQFEFVIYTVFCVLVIPIVEQLLFCGAAFAVLRQFGDPFAILMTAVTAALVTQDIKTMPMTFLITLVGCYGMLSSGTIFTAFAVNIIYRMYVMALSLIETSASENMPIMRNLFMLLLFIIGAVGLAIYRGYVKKHNIKLALYSSELSYCRRVLHSAKIFPYSVVAIICLVSAFMKAVL